MVATPPPYVSLCESALSFGLSLTAFVSALINRLRAGAEKSALQKIAGVVLSWHDSK